MVDAALNTERHAATSSVGEDMVTLESLIGSSLLFFMHCQQHSS
jgi:hypothetical protein